MRVFVGIAVVVALTSIASAEMMAPRMVSPFRRYCMGPAKWGELATCFEKRAPTTAVQPSKSKHARFVDESGMRYLFVEFAPDQWRNVRVFPIDTYEIQTDMKDLVVGTQKLRRIEVRHRIDMVARGGSLDRLFERIAFVCPVADGYCTQLTYHCVVMSRGHATETFIGEVIADDKGVRVEGDRSQTGERCRGR